MLLFCVLQAPWTNSFYRDFLIYFYSIDGWTRKSFLDVMHKSCGFLFSVCPFLCLCNNLPSSSASSDSICWQLFAAQTNLISEPEKTMQFWAKAIMSQKQRWQKPGSFGKGEREKPEKRGWWQAQDKMSQFKGTKRLKLNATAAAAAAAAAAVVAAESVSDRKTIASYLRHQFWLNATVQYMFIYM